MEEYSLTYDFGSGSVKAALIGSQHQILASMNQAYTTYYPEKGWAVQEPSVLWQALQTVTKGLMQSSGLLPSQIKGLAFSHTGSTIVFVDRNGTPLSPCVMWMDGRAVEQAKWLNQQMGQELYTGKNVIAKLRWFLEKQPDLIRSAYKCLDLQGYFFHRLTGNFVYEYTGARTTRLFDVFNGCWDSEKFLVSEFPRYLIPDRVVRSSDLVGRLTGQSALELGLQAGTPVFGGCCDHATAILGTGSIHPGDAHIYIGTSAWLAVTAQDYEDTATIRPSPVPGQWYHYQESDSGGSCADFLWKMFYQKDAAEQADFNAIISEESSDISAYKEVLFLPFLTGASAPINDVRVRASLLNLEASTTRGQIARAVLDGLAFNLRWLKEFYAQQHGWNINCLRGIGGGMLLPESVQTIATVLGDPITVMRDPRYAGNVGLASCIEVGLREHPEGYSVLEHSNNYECTYYPQEQFRERYERLYPLYKKAFFALSEIYNELNKRKDE